MKTKLRIVGITAVALSLAAAVKAADLDKLKVLYIGDTGTPRAQQFTGFLAKNVGRVEVASRKDFKPADAAGFDVVLLDWPQSETAREERKAKSPLCDRLAGIKPTRLLG